jgi:hypothetical protein
MDEILGDSPTNSSPHSIDVGKLSIEVPSTSGAASLPDSPETCEDLSEKSTKPKKRKSANFEYIKIKKLHYEHKNEMCKGKEKNLQHF